MEPEMSVMFDLTIAGPEILDSVIFMEKSPAYAAFKEEIEKILADFNKSKRFGAVYEIDVKSLVQSSSEAIRNMHRSFLFWVFNDDLKNKRNNYDKYLKLFFKSQESQITAQNGGSKLIDAKNIPALKDKYITEISKNPDLFNALKEFFSGYVYGYFFNYLTEQLVMKDYAEFIVCLGIMSNKITASEADKQKMLPKTAALLNNDRFKYIGGEVPLDLAIKIVYSRFELTNVSPEESSIIIDALKSYMITTYEYNDQDDLIEDGIMTTIMTNLNSGYIPSTDFVNKLHKNAYDGVRTFLDADRNDMSAYTVQNLLRVIAGKCSENFDAYYTSGRDAVMEFGLNSDSKGYKYPLVYKEKDVFWFADIYNKILFPAIDKNIYVEISDGDLPIAMFPFADNALRTNIIRFIGGLKNSAYSIRSDKREVLIEINALPQNKKLSDDDKKMIALEKLLYVISGNMDCNSYQRLLHEHVFGTKLYEDYIRYRMDCIFSKGMKSLDAKKNLLDELNRIK